MPTSESTGVASPYPRPSPDLAGNWCCTRGVFLRGTRRTTSHTPKTQTAPDTRAPGEAEWRNKSEAAPTYPTRGNVGFFLKVDKKKSKVFMPGSAGQGELSCPGVTAFHPEAACESQARGSWLEARGLNPSPRPRPSASLQTARREGLKTFTSPLKYHFNFKGLGAGSATSGWKEQAKAPLVLPTRAGLKSTLLVPIIATRGRERSIPTAASSPPARRKKKAD